MKNYTLVTDVKMDFIANRLGEGDVDMPEELATWYDMIVERESGYVVSLDGVPGFLYTMEESHMGQPEESYGFEYAQKHGSLTEENVFILLEELAGAMKEQASDYRIFIGRGTGFYGCHEYCVFFPMGSNVNDILSIIKLTEIKYDELIDGRWNSFYELLQKT